MRQGRSGYAASVRKSASVSACVSAPSNSAARATRDWPGIGVAARRWRTVASVASKSAKSIGVAVPSKRS